MRFVIGDVHEILVELEGMGGGGKVQMEVCFLRVQILWGKVIGQLDLVDSMMSMHCMNNLVKQIRL